MIEMKKRNIILIFILGFSIGIIFTILVTRIPSVRYDVNNDGKVTPYDAVKVINYYLDQGQ